MNQTITPPKAFPGVELTAAQQTLKLLLVGWTGTGKSRFALSACQDERFSPVCWLDATLGTTGILDDARACGAKVYQCGDSKSIIAQCEWLLANPGVFRTLVVDDFSDSFSQTKESVAKAKGRSGADALEGIDYAAIYERNRRLFRTLVKVASPPPNGAGMHVIVTCWPEVEEHPTEAGLKLLVPRLSGKFGYEMPGYFDIVGYLESQTTLKRERGAREGTTEFSNTLITMGTKYLVKDRFDKLPPKLTMPTASTVLDFITGVAEPPTNQIIGVQETNG